LDQAREEFARSIGILRLLGARLEWAKSCLAAGSCALFPQRDRLATWLRRNGYSRGSASRTGSTKPACNSND